MKKLISIFILPLFLLGNAAGQVVLTYDNNINNPGATNTAGDDTPAQNDKPISGNIPAGSTNVIIQLWGGGGGGGGARTSSVGTRASAGGGGGGGYITKTFSTISQFSFSGQVGKCGLRGESAPSATTGSTGGESNVTFSGTTFRAYGGNGGKGASTSSGTASGSSGSGGGTSQNGDTYSNGTGGGTGGTGLTDNSGGGGGTYNISGVSGVGGGTAKNGINGYNSGGGASGGHTMATGQNAPGGVGGGGRVIIQFTTNAPVISGTNTYCEGNTITLTSSYGAGGGVTLQWYKDNVAIGSATGQTLSISGATTANNGVYKVIVTFNNIDYSSASSLSVSNLPYGIAFSGRILSGSLTSNEITVTVNQPTQSPIIPVTICEGQTYNGNGFSGINTGGLHTRVIVGGNSKGCDSTVRINLTINPKPSNISEAYQDVCPLPISTMVTWASLVGTYTGILHWYQNETGGAEIPEPPAFDASVDFTATYWVSQTIGACETSRTRVYVNINEAPVPNIIPAEVCQQTNTKEWNTVVVPQSGESIYWYTDVNVANAEYAARILNSSFSFTGTTMPPAQDLSATGTYTIWVILERDATGCHSVVSPAEIVINAAPTVNLLSDELCEHTPGELIQLEFTGIPDFTLNYTVDIAGVGTGLNPIDHGFPTVFGSGQPGVVTWTGSGTNWSAGIATIIPGFFTFNVVEITDGNGCQSTKP